MVTVSASRSALGRDRTLAGREVPLPRLSNTVLSAERLGTERREEALACRKARADRGRHHPFFPVLIDVADELVIRAASPALDVGQLVVVEEVIDGVEVPSRHPGLSAVRRASTLDIESHDHLPTS